MHHHPSVPADPASDEAPALEATTLITDTDDDADDLDAIFMRAVVEIDTQPLPSPQPEQMDGPTTFVLVLFILSYLGGTLLALLTYPTVTITLVPVTRRITWTTSLEVPTRLLAPVTLTVSLTTETTGTGHQEARRAVGTLTFYNGQANAHTIPAGTILTGPDGVTVTTDAPVTIPAGSPPMYGQASVTAHALVPGSADNLAAEQINTTIGLALFVKNGPFSGGQNQRDYQAVAARDQVHLVGQLQHTLMQETPGAFALAAGEQVFPIRCAFSSLPDHPVGAEARTLTITATETCHGVAYNAAQVNHEATTRFIRQAIPAPHYQLLGAVRVTVLSVAPLTVSCTGWWVYTLSQDDEQVIAGRLVGDSPQQAKSYLLHLGGFTQVSVPQPLPKDPDYIHFRVMIGR